MKTALVVLAACGCVMAPSVSMAKTAAAGPMAAPAKLHCGGHGDAESMTMEEAQETPLYVMLQGKLGDPTGCALSRSGESESFAVSFAKGATPASGFCHGEPRGCGEGAEDPGEG